MKNFDEKIRQSLLYGTEDAAKQKDIVYDKIIKNINTKGDVYKMKRSLFKKVMAASALSAAVIALFFTLTPTGRVLAENIAKYFAPEKKIENEIEGQNNDTDANLLTNTSSEMGYAIYIDTEYYSAEKSGSADIIKANNMPEGYPPVQMSITQISDKKPDELHAQIIADNEGKYATVRDDEAVTIPVEGLKVTLIKGTNSKDAYEKMFIVDNKAGGSFVIHQKLFVEAEEGHGARFDNMLRTFEIFKSDELAQ